MKEEINDCFFKEKLYNNFEKTSEKIINQSTELLQTEDMFINQKEEIKRIKKKRIEIKNNKQNITNHLNKGDKIRKEKKFYTLKNINFTEMKKPIRNNIKSNPKDNNKNILKKNKKLVQKNLNIRKLKLKFPFDNKYNTNNEENNINENNNINKEKNNIHNDDKDYEKTIINNDNESNINLEGEIDFISLSNMNNFQKCDCIINEIYFNDFYDDVNDLDEIPKITEKWTNFNKINKNDLSSSVNVTIPKILNNFDFSKKAILTKNIIDYNTKGVKINIHLKLYEKSTFWIFTRCYVGDYFENIKRHKTITASSHKLNLENINEKENNNKKIFNKYSTVIKIFKNKNSNKSFVSFGTFYKNKKSGNLHYKTFLQRQLVDYVHEDNNYYYLENDLCEFDIIIIDLGNEFLQAKISLNNKEKFNNIKCNFYLPTNKKAKLMFCGEGNNIIVTELEIKSFFKYDEDIDKFGLIISNDSKACDCCSII
jgi:hypothetical protein